MEKLIVTLRIENDNRGSEISLFSPVVTKANNIKHSESSRKNKRKHGSSDKKA